MAAIVTIAPEIADDLVVANQILFDQGVLDGFGHISVRHDRDPAKYVMARHLAPGLVTEADLLEFNLDSEPVVDIGKRYYSERFIHGEIYRTRPDVMSVVHTHASSLIPFGVTKAKLRAIYHMSGFIGVETPVFEIREADGETDMLISSPLRAKALSVSLGARPMVLMRGHGATVVGASIRQSVYRAVYAMMNAQLQSEALKLGEVNFLTETEAMKAAESNNRSLDRPWEMWKRQVLER
jgi:ribulose-5-phosphate 4-epimerase/fuculose-1-phosphate aldolase